MAFNNRASLALTLKNALPRQVSIYPNSIYNREDSEVGGF